MFEREQGKREILWVRVCENHISSVLSLIGQMFKYILVVNNSLLILRCTKSYKETISTDNAEGAVE